MYGERKPIALRKPISTSEAKKIQKVKRSSQLLPSVEDNTDHLSTPPATEGETATDTETETECEGKASDTLRSYRPTQPIILESAISQHDLHHKYFRRDVVILHNIDLLRQVRLLVGCIVILTPF
jgi:phosphatidylethanolamine N-methyltransferase